MMDPSVASTSSVSSTEWEMFLQWRAATKSTVDNSQAHQDKTTIKKQPAVDVANEVDLKLQQDEDQEGISDLESSTTLHDEKGSVGRPVDEYTANDYLSPSKKFSPAKKIFRVSLVQSYYMYTYLQ